MSSAPAMTLHGNADASLLNSMPGAGQGSAENTSKPLQYKAEPIAPRLYPDNIDYSTRRGVLPCKGINHMVLKIHLYISKIVFEKKGVECNGVM